MKKTKNVIATIILLIAGICLCACGKNKQALTSTNTSGILHQGCFYEDNIITMSATERFMYSEWEPAGYEYICTDPTCSHVSDSCYAGAFQGNGSQERNLCVVYRDRLVIIDSYVEHVDHGSHITDGVTSMDVSYVWHTDVYEADLDGGNRKHKLSFDGGIASVTMTFAAVLEEGVLYFGGPIESRIIMEYDEDGVVSRNEVIHSDAFYAMDLENYSVRLFAEADGKDSMSYSYYVGLFDGYVYARTLDSWFGRGDWYRMDINTGEWDNIMHFDSDAPWFFGAIGDNVYYYYNDKTVLYSMDVETKEERELLAVEQDRMFLVAAVMEDQIWVMTEYSMPDYDMGVPVAAEESLMSEYVVLNGEGDMVGRYHYDDYILFYGVVEDRLIYTRNVYPNEEIWWADQSDIADLTERGVYIGHADGRYNDPLFFGAD